MKRRKYVRDIEKMRRTRGCLTDCVAYYLNVHPENVPYFVYPRNGWMNRVKRFFRKHGYEVFWTDCLTLSTLPKRGTHIVCGNSLKYKTFAHVVVYKNGKLVYDPDYPSKWKDDRMTHRLVVMRKSQKRPSKNDQKKAK